MGIEFHASYNGHVDQNPIGTDTEQMSFSSECSLILASLHCNVNPSVGIKRPNATGERCKTNKMAEPPPRSTFLERRPYLVEREKGMELIFGWEGVRNDRKACKKARKVLIMQN